MAVGAKLFTTGEKYISLPEAAKELGINLSSLPYGLRILLENAASQ
ncbi:MAG: hypothetical protein KatS3mg025_1491 [Bacteroidia bacterium]|nr:MAG: hypothetical protein KatS3mg025_1491 [Bacteroidia bacterium]